jgi:hypothetical protein
MRRPLQHEVLKKLQSALFQNLMLKRKRAGKYRKGAKSAIHFFILGSVVNIAKT